MNSVIEKLEIIKELAGNGQELALKGENVLSILSQIYRIATETSIIVENIGEEYAEDTGQTKITEQNSGENQESST